MFKFVIFFVFLLIPVYSQSAIIVCSWPPLSQTPVKENIFFEESVNDAGGLRTLVTTSSSYAEANGDIVVTTRKEIEFFNLKIQQVRKLFLTEGKYYKVLLGFIPTNDARKKFDAGLECGNK